MMPEKIEITRDTPLSVGDIIEIHFRTLSMIWLKAAHIAAIERTVRREGHFDIIRSNYTDGTIVLTLKVIKNPVVTAGLVTVLILSLLISTVVFAMVDKIYKIVEMPGGSVSSGLWAVVAGLGVWALLKMRK